MYIAKISGHKIKGQTFNHPLGARTIITGRNDSGKTARINALQLALLGYVPGDPPRRKSAAIMELSSASFMDVEAVGSDGNVFHQGWKSVGDSIKADRDNTDPLDIPMLDAAAFFRMGPSERLAYTFSKVSLPAEYSLAGIVAKARGVTIDGEQGKHHEAARADLSQLVQEVLAEAATLSLGLAEVTASTGKLAKAAAYQRKRADETIGAVRVAMELRTREGECSAETLDTIGAELRKANAARDVILATLSELEAKQRTLIKNREKRANLEKLLSAPVPTTRLLAALRIELTTVNNQLDKLGSAPVDTVALATNLQELKGRFRSTTAQCAVALDERDALRVQIRDLMEAECCPFCRSHSAGWRDTLRIHLQTQLDEKSALVDKFNADLEKIKTAGEEAKLAKEDGDALALARTDATKKKASLERDIERQESAHREAEASRRHAEEQLAELGTAEDELLPAAIETQRAELKADDATIADLTRQRDAAVSLSHEIKRAAEAAEEHDIAQARLAIAKAMLSTLKETQATMIQAGIGPVLARANAIMGRAFPTELVFHDGDIGRWEGSSFVKVLAFGGATEALAFVAISAALAADAKARIVVLDEFDRLDDEKQEVALACLSRAVDEGLLDQVVIACPRRPVLTPEWEVIAL
jgi:hypothetical protein